MVLSKLDFPASFSDFLLGGIYPFDFWVAGQYHYNYDVCTQVKIVFGLLEQIGSAV